MHRNVVAVLLIVSQVLLLPILLHLNAALHVLRLPYFFCGLYAIIILFLGLTLIITGWIKTDRTVAVLALLCGALLNFCIFVTVPVTIDRSISVYFLSNAYRLPGDSITREDASRIMDRYLPDTDGVARRLSEQIASGTLRLDEGKRYKKTAELGIFIELCNTLGVVYAVNANHCADPLDSSR